jgi:hypothetical protein
VRQLEGLLVALGRRARRVPFAGDLPVANRDRVADTDSHGDCYADTHRDRHGNTHADRDTHADSDTDPDSHPDSHRDCDGNTHADPDIDRDTHAEPDTHRDTHAVPVSVRDRVGGTVPDRVGDPGRVVLQRAGLAGAAVVPAPAASRSR